jgi:chromosome partitioning protein
MIKNIVIFANQKGGVGKTTLCREMGIYFSSIGMKILFLDGDPQGNLTNGLIENNNKSGLYEALTGEKFELKKYSDNLYILSGDNRLTGLSKSLVGEIDAYTRLREVLEDQRFKEFDYIFIDSRPAFDALTINGFTSATDVIIPMSPAEYTLQGTNDLLSSISKVKNNFNPEIKITGIIINSYDPRPVITREIREEIIGVFGDKVFGTALSKTIKIEESIASKIGVIYLSNIYNTKVREEVTLIGNELLKRLEGL